MIEVYNWKNSLPTLKANAGLLALERYASKI